VSNKIRLLSFQVKCDAELETLEARMDVVFEDMQKTKWGCKSQASMFHPSSVEHDYMLRLHFENLLSKIQEGKKRYDLGPSSTEKTEDLLG